MKRIILEYSSFPLFRSFNRWNGKFIPLFSSLRLRLGVHKGREENGMEWNDHKGMEINEIEWNIIK